MEYPGSLTPVAKDLDKLLAIERVHLIEAKVGTGSKVPLIRLLVDREDKFITIDDCVVISKEIKEILDRSDCFPGGYRLEVSSPGLSHHLREPWEFRKHLDRKLRMFYLDDGQMKEVEGYLEEIDAETLILKSGDSEVSIPFDQLDHGRSVIDWQKRRSGRAG